MTALLTFLCALYSYFKMPSGPSPKGFVALLLVLESGTLATFAVLDLILFFLAFEMVLIPMYFLIARWGGEGRQAAAWKFILFTLLGSVVMLLGLLLIGVKAGTFDMVALAADNGRGLTTSVQVIAVLAIGIGLAVKTPMWPLHSWLPDAHTAAPTVGSVLLAGVLLKMGTYGFVRILLPVAPDGMRVFAPTSPPSPSPASSTDRSPASPSRSPATRATSSASSRTRPSATWASCSSASRP